MTSGQMLLAGFNGLFTKVASELSDMFAAFERVHFDKRASKFDVVRDAQKLQVKILLCLAFQKSTLIVLSLSTILIYVGFTRQVTNSAKNAELLGKLFFLKRLEVIISFFNSCRLVTLTLKGNS